MKFLKDLWALRPAYGSALDVLFLLSFVCVLASKELEGHPLIVGVVILVAPFYLIRTLRKLLHDIGSLNPRETKAKMSPELDHPELEHRPWGDPDTWVPPERPLQ